MIRNNERTLEFCGSEVTLLTSKERLVTLWRGHPEREHFLSCAPKRNETNFGSYSSHYL